MHLLARELIACLQAEKRTEARTEGATLKRTLSVWTLIALGIGCISSVLASSRSRGMLRRLTQGRPSRSLSSSAPWSAPSPGFATLRWPAEQRAPGAPLAA